MLRALLLAVIAAGVAVFFRNKMNSDRATAASLPPDPAGRRVALRMALAASGVTGAQADILVGQAILETANLMSVEFPLSLSAWNRHVGSGSYGDWNGKVCMLDNSGRWTVYASDTAALADDPTNAREHLRCFDSLEQCVRDMVGGLLLLPLYAAAKKAFDAGDKTLYAAAIVAGDGRQGFVGPVNTTKALNYTAALNAAYQRGVA